MTVIATRLGTFPECPGYGFASQPMYLVKINARDGGYESVRRRWPRPLSIYPVVPMGPRDEAVAQDMLYFYHCVGGRSIVFRFKDYADFKSCRVSETPTALDQPFLVLSSESGAHAYQLTKIYIVGSIEQVRDITSPNGDTIMVANESGITQDPSTWKIDEDTGLVITLDGFSGVPTSWGGEFFVPCRFDSEFTIEATDKELQTCDFTVREKKRAPNVFADAPPPTFPLDWVALSDAPDEFNAIGFGNGNIMAPGVEKFMWKSADDGSTWAKVKTLPGTLPGTEAWDSVIGYAGGTWLAISHDGSTNTTRVYRSTDDGATWTPATATIRATGLAGDGAGNWVATLVGSITPTTSYAKSTDDGLTWSTASNVTGIASWSNSGLVYENGLYISKGAQPTTFNPAIYSSADGHTWTEDLFSGGATGNLGRVLFDGTHYAMTVSSVAGHEFRRATTLSALAAVTGVDAKLTSPRTIIYGDGIFFVFGDPNIQSSSSDGSLFSLGNSGFSSTGPNSGGAIYNPSTKNFVAVNEVFPVSKVARFTAP